VKDRIDFFKKVGAVFLLLLIGLTSYFRVLYSSTYAGSWDQVDFALALDRYDLLAMQPHFPGYPYFILGGTFLHQWVDDPSRALAIFNTLMIMIATLPIYFLSRRYLSSFNSLLTCTVIQSLSYLWIMSTESMSEASAISVLWWYLWSLQRTYEKNTKSLLLSLFIFSLLMGIRLSYIPFGLGLVFLIISKRGLFSSKLSFLLYIIQQLIIAVMFQLIWVLGLAATEGSLGNFFSLSMQFINGHFTDWGGAITSVSMPLYERFYRLVFINILWVGVCGQSVYTAALLGLVIVLVVIGLIRGKWKITYSMVCFSLLAVGYFCWALFAQNIDKPRHALPLIVLFTFSMVILILKNQRQRVITYILLSFFIIIQSVNGYSFVKEKASSAPATYQLANYLKDYNEPFVIYTWEEARIMDYLRVKYPYERVLTYDYFLSNVKQRQNKRILITSHVVKGFRDQGIVIDKKVQEVKTFYSNSLFDPIYNEITVYEWVEEVVE
jgi:hypothetical protein